MRPTLRTLAAAGLVAALAGTAAAQPGPGGPRGGGGLARIMDELNLTDAQKQKVQPLLDEHRAAVQGLRERMRTDRETLRSALQAAQPDATTVGKAAIAMKADRDAVKAQRDAFHGKLAKVLTPEQNAKLEGFLAGVRAGRGMGGGMGMRRGGMRGGGFGR